MNLNSIKFVDQLDLSVSYTELAYSEVRRITSLMPSEISVYEYKQWLDKQAGHKIETLAEVVYGDIPCIIFATLDWYTRPATVLEMSYLRNNQQRKLVLDYPGTFEMKKNEHRLHNYQFASFDGQGEIDMRSIFDFLKQLRYIKS